jgi:hypothetical protein
MTYQATKETYSEMPNPRPMGAIWYCFECKRETRTVSYDSNPERHANQLGVHYVGSLCLECGDIDGEPCIHD